MDSQKAWTYNVVYIQNNSVCIVKYEYYFCKWETDLISLRADSTPSSTEYDTGKLK